MVNRTCIHVYAEVLSQQPRLLSQQLRQQGGHLRLGAILVGVLHKGQASWLASSVLSFEPGLGQHSGSRLASAFYGVPPTQPPKPASQTQLEGTILCLPPHLLSPASGPAPPAPLVPPAPGSPPAAEAAGRCGGRRQSGAAPAGPDGVFLLGNAKRG